MIPELPELPDMGLPSLKAVGRPRRTALPDIQQVQFTNARAEEAAQMANDMRRSLRRLSKSGSTPES